MNGELLGMATQRLDITDMVWYGNIIQVLIAE